jgi:glycosyltransferase involved in cell wall biosynthesis
MIEAMAEGVPIVAADIPAVREVLENDKTALIVPAGDEEALAEALADLAEDPGKAQKLARNARALYERKFTWPEHIKSLQAVFAECY